MKIIAMIGMSDGNENAGETWVETKIFDYNESSLREIIDWAFDRTNYGLRKGELPTSRSVLKNLRLQIASEED